MSTPTTTNNNTITTRVLVARGGLGNSNPAKKTTHTQGWEGIKGNPQLDVVGNRRLKSVMLGNMIEPVENRNRMIPRMT